MIYEKFEERKRALSHPPRVEKPKLLGAGMVAANMSDAELASIPRLRQEYAEALAARLEAVKAYDIKAAEISNEFWEACQKEYAPWANARTQYLLYSEAYDRGHAYGYSEMEAKYDELATFAQTIIKFQKEE